MATVRVYAVDRPYILSYRDGSAFLLTGEEAQRLLDAYPATVRGGAAYLKDEGKIVATLSPATIGGGPAFRVYRAR